MEFNGFRGVVDCDCFAHLLSPQTEPDRTHIALFAKWVMMYGR